MAGVFSNPSTDRNSGGVFSDYSKNSGGVFKDYKIKKPSQNVGASAVLDVRTGSKIGNPIYEKPNIMDKANNLVSNIGKGIGAGVNKLLDSKGGQFNPATGYTENKETNRELLSNGIKNIGNIELPNPSKREVYNMKTGKMETIHNEPSKVKDYVGGAFDTLFVKPSEATKGGLMSIKKAESPLIGIIEGATGERKTTFNELMPEGYQEATKKYPALMAIPNFLGEILTSPDTYIGGGLLNQAVKKGTSKELTKQTAKKMLDSNALNELKKNIGNLYDKSLIDKKLKEEVMIGKITPDEADHIRDNLGIDVLDYERVLQSDRVRHMDKQHGSAKTEVPRGQMPISKEDIVNLPDIYKTNIDSVKLGKGKNGATELHYLRDNKTIGYGEAIGTQKKRLYPTTLWKKNPLLDADSKLSPQANILDARYPSNNIILNPAENINKGNTKIPSALPEVAPTVEKVIPQEEASQLIMPVKDTSGFDAYTNDIDRIFKKVYGKNYEEAKAKYLTPLNESKKNNQLMQQEILTGLKNDIVDKFGFKKGSKESAAIQWYGEGKKFVGMEDMIDLQTGKKVKQAKLESYTLNDLKKDFPNNWQDIVEADKWFRTVYDQTIDKINSSRKTIYGDVQAKVKAVEDEIQSIAGKLDQKTAERYGLEQGRPYKTNKEIEIEAQIKELQEKVDKLKGIDNPLNAEKIDNLQKRIAIKQDQLKKANLSLQPTAKQFDVSDKQIARLEGLLKNKKDLIESEGLWRNKFIPRREDYYRHFREITEGVDALKNLFDTPAQINPSLAGISDFTKPNSKFLSLAQRRGKGAYKADAVGGMLDYAKAASYATHIDPHIQKFRNLASDLAKETEDTKNLNHFIEYLNDFADSLAGKTNPFDRPIQKVVGRKTMNVVNWTNSRVKANTVLGNAASSIAQFANIPNGIAYVKNPKNLMQGMIDTIASIKVKNNPMKESGFLMERYGGKLYSQFDTKILEQPKKFAAWLLGAGDEIGTKFIWNSTYRQALEKGIKNPIQHADDITRSLVAGRGIGEVPLLQQSRVFQVVAPFQLEVANLWRVMGDRVSEKDFAGLATLLVASYLFNRGAEQIRGSGVTFDPIKAVQDALAEKDTNVVQKVGRLGGEVLSNIPLGSNIADMVMTDSQKKKYFGKEDPTRYGSGLVLTKGIQDPLFKLVPPFGGGQIKKTIEGMQTLNRKGAYKQTSKGEELLYPIEPTVGNKIKGALFGKSSFPETKDYYDNERQPLGTNQTQDFKDAVNSGLKPKDVYNQFLKLRELKPEGNHKGVTIEQKRKSINSNPNFTEEQKQLLRKLLLLRNKAN